MRAIVVVGLVLLVGCSDPVPACNWPAGEPFGTVTCGEGWSAVCGEAGDYAPHCGAEHESVCARAGDEPRCELACVPAMYESPDASARIPACEWLRKEYGCTGDDYNSNGIDDVDDLRDFCRDTYGDPVITTPDPQTGGLCYTCN